MSSIQPEASSSYSRAGQREMPFEDEHPAGFESDDDAPHAHNKRKSSRQAPSRLAKRRKQSESSKQAYSRRKKKQDAVSSGSRMAQVWDQLLQLGSSAEGREKLKVWEDAQKIHMSMLAAWPTGPRVRNVVHEFVHSDASPKPNSLSSWRYRWLLGLSQKIYGRLEDVRWILLAVDPDDTEAEQIRKIFPVARRHYIKGQQDRNVGEPSPDDEYIFTDRHRPGPVNPRDPSDMKSGCVYAACLLTAFRLRQIDKAVGWDGETMPSDVFGPQWDLAISKLYRHCWYLRKARALSAKAVAGTDHQLLRRHVFDDTVKLMVSFIWTHAIKSQDRASPYFDKNVANVWSSMAAMVDKDPKWLSRAWRRLKDVAVTPFSAVAEPYNPEEASVADEDDDSSESGEESGGWSSDVLRHSLSREDTELSKAHDNTNLAPTPEAAGEVSEAINQPRTLRSADGNQKRPSEDPCTIEEIRPIRSRNVKRLSKLLGQIKPAVDVDVLSSASVREWVSPLPQVEDANFWVTHWQTDTIPELQRKLHFWCTWAMHRPQTPEPSHVREIFQRMQEEEAASGQQPWTIETFLSLRKTRLNKAGQPEPFAFSRAQLEGALWFLHKCLSSSHVGTDKGGIIGDKMGTGKTLQGILIFLLASKLQLFGQRPALLVADRKLLSQWYQTFWSVVRTSKNAVDSYGYKAGVQPKSVMNEPICIPWYVGQNAGHLPGGVNHYVLVMAPWTNCMENCSKDGNTSLASREWGLVLCDEGHKLWSTTSAHLSNSASHNSFQRQLFSSASIQFRLLLSGTPLVNDLNRQWTVFRSAGIRGIAPSELSPLPGSRWTMAIEAQARHQRLVQRNDAPLQELGDLQEELLTVWATYMSATNREHMADLHGKIKATLRRINDQVVALTELRPQMIAEEDELHEVIRSYLLPTPATLPVPLPLPSQQPALIRRRGNEDTSPHASNIFVVRATGNNEYQNMVTNMLHWLSARAARKEAQTTLKNGFVSEPILRAVATHPCAVPTAAELAEDRKRRGAHKGNDEGKQTKAKRSQDKGDQSKGKGKGKERAVSEDSEDTQDGAVSDEGSDGIPSDVPGEVDKDNSEEASDGQSSDTTDDDEAFDDAPEALPEGFAFTDQEYAEAKEAVAQAERELISKGLPIRHRAKTGLTAAVIAMYSDLVAARDKLANMDFVKYRERLSAKLGSSADRRTMIAEMPTPLSSLLLAILRAIDQSQAGRPVQPEEWRNYVPKPSKGPVKILIFATNHTTIHWIAHLLRAYSYPSYHLVNAGGRQGRLIQAWEQSKTTHILLLTQKDVVGLELQRANVLFLWDIPTSVDVQLQAIGRIARRGQGQDCFTYVLEATGTYCDRAKTLQKMKTATTGALEGVRDRKVTLSTYLLKEVVDIVELARDGGLVGKDDTASLDAGVIEKRFNAAMKDVEIAKAATARKMSEARTKELARRRASVPVAEHDVGEAAEDRAAAEDDLRSYEKSHPGWRNDKGQKRERNRLQANDRAARSALASAEKRLKDERDALARAQKAFDEQNQPIDVSVEGEKEEWFAAFEEFKGRI